MAEQFDYDRMLASLLVPEVLSALADVHEHRGREQLYVTMAPDVLDSLVESARIQSTGASNRIENISTSDKRLRELVTAGAKPHTRDEREIVGYRYVLDEIHVLHDDIPVMPNVILQLHRALYRFTEAGFAGRWKDSDNVIVEQGESGEMVVRFRPTSAVATPHAMERICDEYARQIGTGRHDPLLVSLVFAFDFVSIHPFNDGNGRMSRLLILLLLYRNGYLVGKYVSIEREIERTRQTYYEALAASSVGWKDATSDYTPFVTYMLGVLIACYGELDERVARLSSGKSNEDILRAYFDGLMGAATKYEIMDANPSMSQRTIERILQRLQAEGAIEKVGAARATMYRVRR